jgi:hypothetical protein
MLRPHTLLKSRFACAAECSIRSQLLPGSVTRLCEASGRYRSRFCSEVALGGLEVAESNADNLRTIYSEVCRSYHAIVDFRAKLLALLPIATGAGGLLILTRADTVKQYLAPIGIFGAVVTFGLFVYELRGIQRCKALIETGREIEDELRISYGQFVSRPKARGLISAETAGWIVYTTVFAAWSYLAIIGFRI